MLEQPGPAEILLEVLEAVLRVTLYFVQGFHPGKDSHSQKKGRTFILGYKNKVLYLYQKSKQINNLKRIIMKQFDVAQKKREGWINLYKDVEGTYITSQVYETKTSAEASSCRTCIATIKIEWEE